MKNNLAVFVTIFLLIGSMPLLGQPTYAMQNLTVDDCKGTLTDSNEGPEPDLYDHDEDYTFTICVPFADEIILNFSFFATEAGYDILTIYEGPDKTGPVVAILDGVLQTPPSFVIKNECVTFHFVTDDNILAKGWSMTWEVIIDDPEIPELMLDQGLTCPLDAAKFKFDIPVDCDLLTKDNFSLIGPGMGQIERIEALNCDPTTNTTTEFIVHFVDSLRIEGTYRLTFEGRVQDVCGEWHDISTTVTFNLTGCPIVVLVETSAFACEGDCGRVRATVIGGKGNYRYQWSHTTDQNEEVDICTDDTTQISVTVVDLNTAIQTSATYTYVPLPNPRILNKLEKDTFCSNRSNHTFNVDLPGGKFTGRGKPAWQEDEGLYNFWRWNGATDTEEEILTYTAPNGCVDMDTFYINPIYAGTHEAACIGAAAFNLNGGTPRGGLWSGDHVSPGGVFDPTTVGEFRITYTAPNGCSGSKWVRVTDRILMPDIDTVCGAMRIEIRATPFGGRWSGPRVVNNYTGSIDVHLLTPNRSYTYYYNLKGCTDSLTIYVEEINAGEDKTICTGQDTLFMETTGLWSGPGTYLPTINAFDVSDLGVGTYKYTLEKNDCMDQFELKIIEVDIQASDDLQFCQEDVWIRALDVMDIFPANGTLSSPYFKDSMNTWFFNPAQIPSGRHIIALSALSCSDSLWMDIEGPAVFGKVAFCEFDNAQSLTASPSGGIWQGPGILDPSTGLFDPQLAGRGFHIIEYTSPRGCVSNDTIEVFEFMAAKISGISNIYCNSDSLISVSLMPPGGTFTINGQPSGPSFNPANLGPGSHEFYYASGSGDCASSDRVFVTVLHPIQGQIVASDDSICLGDQAVIEISPTGGRGILTATWNQNLDFGVSHIVSPTSTTIYRVVVQDGCSEDLVDSIEIYVHPEFSIDLDQGPEVCYDEETYTRIILPGDRNEYDVTWLTDPPYAGVSYTGNPGSYSIQIVQEPSGCVQEFDVTLPGAGPLKANFTTIPQDKCIDIINNEIEIIDLATGYTHGYIDFGDSTSSAVKDLVNDLLAHQFEHFGTYTITQVIENDLGCTDTFSLTICVENQVRVFIPNIFSPNGDDNNDVLQLHAAGVNNVHWEIYNRWGELVFKSNKPEDTWDGTLDGQNLNPGVFVLLMTYEDAETGFPASIQQSVTLLR